MTFSCRWNLYQVCYDLISYVIVANIFIRIIDLYSSQLELYIKMDRQRWRKAMRLLSFKHQFEFTYMIYS